LNYAIFPRLAYRMDKSVLVNTAMLPLSSLQRSAASLVTTHRGHFLPTSASHGFPHPCLWAGRQHFAQENTPCSFSPLERGLRLPRPSISTASWRGSTSVHERRRAPPISPPSRRRRRAIQTRPPPKVLASPLPSAPRCTAWPLLILYYKNHYCSKFAKKDPRDNHWGRHTLFLFRYQCLFWSYLFRTFY